MRKSLLHLSAAAIALAAAPAGAAPAPKAAPVAAAPVPSPPQAAIPRGEVGEVGRNEGPAARQAPAEAQAAAKPPILYWLEGRGVKITALGEEGGVRGYFLETPDGQPQSLYVMPDGKHFVYGLMGRLRDEGEPPGPDDRPVFNVTGRQMAAMRQRIADARRAAEQAEQRIAQATDQLGARMVVPPVGSLAPQAAPTAPPAQPAPPPAAPVAGGALQIPPAPAEREEGAKAASAFLSALDKDRFLAAAEKAAWFPVGRESSPEVYMVADPTCPHCHEAWAKLKPLVDQGRVRVNVILISGLPGSLPHAVRLLSQPNQGSAWYSGLGSTPAPRDPSALEAHLRKLGEFAPAPVSGTAKYQEAEGFLRTNGAFAAEMGIKQTPFLAYVGKDGRLYSAFGPKDMDAFLSGL